MTKSNPRRQFLETRARPPEAVRWRENRYPGSGAGVVPARRRAERRSSFGIIGVGMEGWPPELRSSCRESVLCRRRSLADTLARDRAPGSAGDTAASC
jgi:hypothetical protein